VTRGSLLPRLAVLALLAAALWVVLLAGAIDWLACESEGSEACGRQNLARAQLYVAVAGLVPALLLVVDTWRGSRRAVAWLVLGVAVYAVWGLLADAAVHGWDDLVLVPGCVLIPAG
jgi:hypothetical protein